MKGSRMTPTGNAAEYGSSTRPDPAIRRHPLATPQGQLPAGTALHKCELCQQAAACLASVLRMGPFLRADCEAAAQPNTKPGRPRQMTVK